MVWIGWTEEWDVCDALGYWAGWASEEAEGEVERNAECNLFHRYVDIQKYIDFSSIDFSVRIFWAKKCN